MGGCMKQVNEQPECLHDEKEGKLPKYEAPKVITYSEDELLAKLGPAQACSPFGGAILGC